LLLLRRRFMSSVPVPPVAVRSPHITQSPHGALKADPYFWLRNKSDDSVLTHLKAEKDYCSAVLAPTQELRSSIFAELKARLQETDSTAPFRRGGPFEYYQRTVESQQYKIYCRRRVDGSGGEEVLLDLNVEFVEHEFRQLAMFRVSPDENLAALAIDVKGDEQYTVRIKDLRTGKLLDKQIEKVNASLEWSNDSAALFYDQCDATLRPFQVWRAALSGGAPDELLFEEKNALYEMTFQKSSSSRFIVITNRSGVRSSTWAIDCDAPGGARAVPVIERDESVKHEASVDHWKGLAADHPGYWFILSNRDNQREFALYVASVDDVSLNAWRPVTPYSDDIHLKDIQVFAKHLVVHELRGALRRVKVIDLSAFPTLPDPVYIDFPEPVHTIVDLSEQNYNGPLRFLYSSYLTPDVTYEFDFATRALTVTKALFVPNFDAAQYVTELLWATSHDGTKVPISIVRKKQLAATPSLLHLYGYSSYGLNVYPRFDTKIFSLVDRDFVFAVAHARGCSIMGRHWYENGKFEHKMNTFLDFNACAAHLVGLGITTPAQMSIEGRSAGGLLVGACLNLNPGLCRAAVAAVPFVDVVQTMLDDTIPLTVLEYEEWGNPNDKKFFDSMLSYSPIDNIREGAQYPHIFVKAGLNDPRVQYWEPAKWVQKLRHDAKPSLVAFDISLGSGHFGHSGRFSYLEERATELAFLCHFMKQV
jgi:oligopeptidase B